MKVARFDLIFGVLTPLSAIFQLYHGDQFGQATCDCVSSAPFLAHLAFRPCELLSSLFVRRPSVNISHFNLLLRNH